MIEEIFDFTFAFLKYCPLTNARLPYNFKIKILTVIEFKIGLIYLSTALIVTHFNKNRHITFIVKSYSINCN